MEIYLSYFKKIQVKAALIGQNRYSSSSQIYCKSQFFFDGTLQYLQYFFNFFALICNIFSFVSTKILQDGRKHCYYPDWNVFLRLATRWKKARNGYFTSIWYGKQKDLRCNYLHMSCIDASISYFITIIRKDYIISLFKITSPVLWIDL